jgi:protein-S-isoprenylcysteine O-methyltransferase Ste14
MIASEFEYRHRFGIMALLFAFAYAFYNLDHVNVLYAIPFSSHVLPREEIVRLIYAGAALLACIGAMILTLATAYQPSSSNSGRVDSLALAVAGPYRYVRNPHYLGYLLLVIALSSFQSRLGFPIMIAGETIFIVRLIAREELQLDKIFGDRFRDYRQCVPRLLPSLRPRISGESPAPSWRQGFADHVFAWGSVATLLAFACTLNDPVGYAFGGATLLVLVIQRLFNTLRSPEP